MQTIVSCSCVIVTCETWRGEEDDGDGKEEEEGGEDKK